jgi:hypothetical protein
MGSKPTMGSVLPAGELGLAWREAYKTYRKRDYPAYRSISSSLGQSPPPFLPYTHIHERDVACIHST